MKKETLERVISEIMEVEKNIDSCLEDIKEGIRTKENRRYFRLTRKSARFEMRRANKLIRAATLLVDCV